MTTSKKIVTILNWLFGNIIYFITFLVPKKKNFWVFGSWLGEKYTDNSKYLFEYINKNHPEIKVVWLTKSYDTLTMIKKKGYEVLKTYSLKGTLCSMRAQVGIFSHWTSDINIFTISNMKLVNLWHGTPLKKIGRDDIIRIKSLSKIKKIGIKLFPFLTKGFSGGIMIAASPRVRKTFSMAFDMSESNVKVTGYPRNDIFFMKHTEDYPFKSKLEKLQKSYKVGIYLPTHRKKDEQNPTPLFKGYKDYLNSKLKEKRVILLYKYHYFRQKQFENETSGYSNIIILKDDDINQDIYLVLSQVDFLITDYSSAYFDFLLTDKPIIFTPFDIEYYLKYERGFYYKYEEVTPGPIAKTWDELLKYIDDVIKYPDKYKKQREIIRKQFNQYNNGNSSQRVFNEIINSIKNVDHLL